MKGKVTVHFGKIRVVVPCYDYMTVDDLIKASIIRYKNATGRPPEQYIYVHHIECLRDGGILDPGDQLFDVFDENNDQILAIYDEPDDSLHGDLAQTYATRFAINGTTLTTSTTAKSSETIRSSKLNIIPGPINGDVVEITNIAEPPSDGLRVVPENIHQQMPSSSSAVITGDVGGSSTCSATSFPQNPHCEQKRPERIFHSALKNVDGSPKSKHRVVISQDAVRENPAEESSSAFVKETLMTRTSIRKSRLTDSFFDAKERLEDKLANKLENRLITMESKTSQLIPPMEGANRGHTVIILSDSTVNMPLGIEISPINDPANVARLQAVEIRQINSDGRIAEDGRLRIGDQIVEINQRPVYQMSISRARAYLHEMHAIAHPSLTINRHIDTFLNDAISHRSQSSTSSLQKRPVFSALQQANTTAVGTTFLVEIIKRSGGFGFTITSRETAKGERLFYIGTVKADGAAVNKLRAGDRLLQINDETTTELSQNDMVERLKRVDVGDSVKLLVSRFGNLENENSNFTPVSHTNNSQEISCDKTTSKGKIERCREEILTLNIALNETGSAGLGVSLKARAIMKPDGVRHDCGIFIKKVLHGGAAYKDGRLQVNDQLIEIEDIDLRSMKKNSDASDAITKCLKNLGPNATSVRLRIARNLDLRHDCSNMSGIGTSVDESKALNRDAFTISDGQKLRMEDGDAAVSNVEQVFSDILNITESKRPINSLGERPRNTHDDLESNASDKQKYVSEDEISHVDVDAFRRENPARRSISEKRHMGTVNDVSNTAFLQKIKHDRQMSASPKRRSLSLESMEAHKLPMPTTHPSEPALRDAVRLEQTTRRGHPNALKRAQKCRPNGNTQLSMSDAEDRINAGNSSHELYASLPREVSASSKAKQQRRKSVGSSLFSKITQRLGGSRSRETSPEKAVFFDTADRSNINGELNRIQDRRDWDRQRRPPPPYKPPTYDGQQASNSDYFVNDMCGAQKTEFICSGEELPVVDYIRVANSKFYSSFIERNRECPKVEKNNTKLHITEEKVVAAEKNKAAQTSIAFKQQLDSGCTSINNNIKSTTITTTSNSNSNNSNNLLCSRSTETTWDNLANSNSSNTIGDAVGTTMMHPIPGFHAAQQQEMEYRLVHKEELDYLHRKHILPQQQPCHQEQQCNKCITEDSGHVQFNFPQKQCERRRTSKGGLASITQPGMRLVPLVFPTSRTFFVASLSQKSGYRNNTSQTEEFHWNLRNSDKSASVQTKKDRSPVKNSTTQSKNTSKSKMVMFHRKHSLQNQHQSLQFSNEQLPSTSNHTEQQKQPLGSSENSIASGSLFKRIIPSASCTSSKTGLPSSAYLKTLLHSSARTSKNVSNELKPIKYIKIHYGPSHPPAVKQQLPREHSLEVSHSETEAYRQQQSLYAADFDYQKYLRKTRRDRLNGQGQRVTFIGNTANERAFIEKKTATSGMLPKRPLTFSSSTSS